MKNWDAKTKSDFVKSMGKRQKFSKGGLIRRIGNRQYFDTGGMANPGVSTNLSGPVAAGNGSAATNLPSNTLEPITNAYSNLGYGLIPGVNSSLNSITNSLNDNFQASSAPIQPGTNGAQLQGAYTGAQGGLGQQQGLVNTLVPQVGNAVNTQNAVEAQQLGIMNGTGPNPAQTQLAQNTAANVAQTAALQASQRGASGNVGLLARQAGQQGAATQQNAVGQAATLQAGQQIAAGQNLAALANQQVNQTGQGITNLNSAAQNEQSILQNANTAQNNANVQMTSNMNNVNAQTAASNQNMAGNILGGLTGGISSLLAEGGEVGEDGDQVNEGTFSANTDSSNISSAPATASNPATESGKSSGGGGGIAGLAALFAKGGNVCPGPHKSHVANFLFSEGGPVRAMVSPGEIYLTPEKVHAVIREGANPLKIGQKINGKAKVKGDSLKNDTVPMTLEEGGVVIPRHILHKKMSAEKAELFVHRAMARKKARG